MKRLTAEEQWGLVAWNIKPKPVGKPKLKTVKPPRPEFVIEATAVFAFIGCTGGLTVNAIINVPLLWGLALMFGLAIISGVISQLVMRRIICKRSRR